jgi:hypothetical protein
MQCGRLGEEFKANLQSFLAIENAKEASKSKRPIES